MMQTTQLELQMDWKPKIKISSENRVKYDKILSANNMQHSNLTWEEIAGLF